MKRKVSIVMCTYNGVRYLAEQLDTLIAQTYPIHEIIIQDDHSTDGTWPLLQRYAARNGRMRLFRNERQLGVNANFFTAMRRAEGDYIAISDQDDLWEPKKVERQMACIGQNLLCACRSKPFSADGRPVAYDERRPNVHLMRLLYSSIPGHTMLFHRRLLDLLPPHDESLRTYYDVYFSLTAAANDGLVLCDEFLVSQRRHEQAVTYMPVDPRRSPSAGNGLYILRWSLMHFRQVHPHQCRYFQRRLRLMEGIRANGPLFRDALRIVSLQGQEGLLPLLRLTCWHLKYRHHLFYVESRGIVNFCRALLYSTMQTYNYRYLTEV